MKRLLYLAICACVTLNTLSCAVPKEDAPTPSSTPAPSEYFIIVYRTINTGGSEISVTVDGMNAGKITSINAVTPDCGVKSNGYVKYQVASKGTYDVKAAGADGKNWTATQKVTDPGCYFLSISN